MRALRPYSARRPTDGHRMPFGGLAVPLRGPRYSMRHAHAAFEAAWSAVRERRRRTHCRAGGLAWCKPCGRACEQGSGSTPAGSDSEPEPPPASP